MISLTCNSFIIDGKIYKTYFEKTKSFFLVSQEKLEKCADKCENESERV